MKKDYRTIQYQTEGGLASIEVNFEEETVWLSLNQMSELFERDKSVVSRHIKNVFQEGELIQEATVAKFATVQKEGNREITRDIEFFNLDVIISVGYRVKSKRGTNFRIWATQVLRNHLLENARRVSYGKSYEEKYFQLVKTIDIAASTASTKALTANEAEGILKVLKHYGYALDTLDKYDHQSLTIEQKQQEVNALT